MNNDQLNIAELPELQKLPDAFGAWLSDDQKVVLGAYCRSYALAAQAPLIERIKELENHKEDLQLALNLVETRYAELEKQNGELLAFVTEYLEAWDAGSAGEGYMQRKAKALASSQKKGGPND